MPFLSRVRSFWNTLAHKDRLERELDDELRAAVETLTERFVSQGMPADAARAAAIRAIGGHGGIDLVKQEVRELRVGAGLDALLLDLRYAWRGMTKARGFTAVIVITLALGIGANTAIFSVVHATLIEPLPYREADRLVFIWLDRNQADYPRGPMSGPDLRDLRRGTTSFDGIGGIWSPGSITLESDGEPEQLRAALVTTNFFQVLGADSALGRTFRPEDAYKGAEPTILLGWDLFQRRFGGDPTLVGRTIQVNGQRVTVIGVMPKSFRLLLPPDASVPDHLQAWTPFWADLENGPRRNLFLRVVARIRPGVSVSAARDDVAGVAQAISREVGSPRSFSTVSLQADDVREIRAPLLALMAGVGILLAIACVNVASLLIARAASRARETALRLALGASRSRLLRQSLVEGCLLTLLGAAAGAFAGYVALRVLLALTPATLSRLAASRIDLTVLAFTIGISVLWGVLFSLAPLTELFKASPRGSLQQQRSMASPVRYRIRATLVIVQIALSVVLLVSATLLVRAFVEVLRVDPGFRADGQLTFRIAIAGERYDSSEAFNAFGEELRRRILAIPGVTGAGAISHIPYDDLPNWALPHSLTPPLQPDTALADTRAISVGLFESLGVQLLEGRFFTLDDQMPKNPVVIVDDLMARQFWPNRSAIGQQFVARLGSERVTVVGVVRHVKLRSLVVNLTPQIFVPWRIAQRNPIAYVVRVNGDPTAIVPQLRAVVAGLDPRLPIYEVRPLIEYVEAARSTRRFTVLLAGAFALTALVLTCVGVYGILAYAVAHRRHEFGVRRALGADTTQVVGEILREGLGFGVAGCLGGLAAAVAAARLLQGQLYAVHPHDPVSYAVAVGLILAGAAAACCVPAWRATTISPMDALRME
jgi:putative ABC transport system permease protein